MDDVADAAVDAVAEIQEEAPAPAPTAAKPKRKSRAKAVTSQVKEPETPRIEREFESDPLLFSMLLVLGGVLVSMAIALRLSRAFTGPIFQLNEAVARLKEGKLDTRVYTEAGPEFDQLESGLNAMAGELSKADLNSEMVGEFDTMQGIMGFYLAQREGQPDDVAKALYEQYLPRFAGDTLPQSKTGMAVSLADKIDTLVGIFGIGQKPSGTKDPYALRRATLGVLRIIIENELALDLRELLDQAAAQLGERIDANQVEDAFDFIKGRYRAIYQEQGIATPVILSVLAIDEACRKPLDFDRRVKAVAAFQQREEAQALAAANKRVSNILAKLDSAPPKKLTAPCWKTRLNKRSPTW